MDKLKYVRLESYDSIIIFPMIIQHDTFKHLNPVSAGFCVINLNRRRVDCYGESISLKLKSDGKKDTYQATKQVFGVDDALKLIQ